MGRTDTHTVPPDTIWEAHLEFHQKYEYTRLIEPMGVTENKKCQDHRIIRGLFGTMRVHRPVTLPVATTNKEFHNQGFIQGVHGPVHTTIHAGADKTVDLVEPPN